MQMPPTLGQPPIPAIQPRLGCLLYTSVPGFEREQGFGRTGGAGIKRDYAVLETAAEAVSYTHLVLIWSAASCSLILLMAKPT